MKNDLKRVGNLDFEMRINDMVYKKMQYEYNLLNDRLKKGGSDSDEYNQFLLDEHYFFKRVLSIFQNNDMPERACMGLFLMWSMMPKLFLNKSDYIGESDNDNDIYKYVVEYGYRQLDRFCQMDADSLRKLVRESLSDYYKIFREDGDVDDK